MVPEVGHPNSSYMSSVSEGKSLLFLSWGGRAESLAITDSTPRLVNVSWSSKETLNEKVSVLGFQTIPRVLVDSLESNKNS